MDNREGNELARIAFQNMIGYVFLGDRDSALIKASKLTNREDFEPDEGEAEEWLGTTSVIKIKDELSLKEGPIEGRKLYDIISQGSEDPREAIESLLNTLG